MPVANPDTIPVIGYWDSLNLLISHIHFSVCASPFLLGPDEFADSLWCLSVCLLIGLSSPWAASADGLGPGV